MMYTDSQPRPLTWKGTNPQPTNDENKRGAKSRAGLKQAMVSGPRRKINSVTVKPMVEQRVCMKVFSQFRPLVGDKGHSPSQVFFAHGGLEVSQGLVLRLGMVGAPVHEKADHQTAEHSQNPEALGAANPAAILIEGNIQALMGAILNPPSLAIGPQPRAGGQFLGRQVGHQADGFVFASGMLTG